MSFELACEAKKERYHVTKENRERERERERGGGGGRRGGGGGRERHRQTDKGIHRCRSLSINDMQNKFLLISCEAAAVNVVL